MVAVAVMAVLVWSSTLASRWLDYRDRALTHEHVCETLASEIDSFAAQIEDAKLSGRTISANIGFQLAEREKALVDERRLAEIYRRGMSQPWRNVRVRISE
jgi:hypothetical protein